MHNGPQGKAAEREAEGAPCCKLTPHWPAAPRLCTHGSRAASGAAARWSGAQPGLTPATVLGASWLSRQAVEEATFGLKNKNKSSKVQQ